MKKKQVKLVKEQIFNLVVDCQFPYLACGACPECRVLGFYWE